MLRLAMILVLSATALAQTTPAKKRDWIDKHSDHCLLYGEIHS